MSRYRPRIVTSAAAVLATSLLLSSACEEVNGNEVEESESPTRDDEGKQCGGFAGAPCADGEFCNVEPGVGGQGCGVADATGICQTTPQTCTREYAPVCGCDGVTYANDCTAHAARMSIAQAEPCAIGDDPVKRCGGLAGIPCAGDEFCDFENTELVCGRADGLGRCTKRAEVCTREHVPVCGCDGKTYDNRCVAHAAGVSIEHEGLCAR